MAVKLRFDKSGNIIKPTIVLAAKSGNKIGGIPYNGLHFKDALSNPCEVSFNVSKEQCSDEVWDKLVDFKLIYIPEWKRMFEATVEFEDSDRKTKIVTCKSLGNAELSQINLYNLEINTEDDIDRDDYKRAVLFDKDAFDDCILGRVLDRAPHYVVGHVDDTIANIQRSFSFNDTSIMDALNDIAEEIQCLFMFDCYIDASGKIVREINAYDTLQYCNTCGERGEFDDGVCYKCGSKDITDGYGEDTSVFVDKRNLANTIKYSTDTESFKNCFRLDAGDDLMTATIVSCNPNGTPYIWSISESSKEDMSDELRSKLSEYDEMYSFYDKHRAAELDKDTVAKYNSIVAKYNEMGYEYSFVEDDIEGFRELMYTNFGIIDFDLFINESLMPSVIIEKTSAEIEAGKVNESSFEIGVKDIDKATATSVNNAALSIVKTIVNGAYKSTIIESRIEDVGGNKVWIGKFKIESYADDEDVCDTNEVSYRITDDYVGFIKQKVEKAIADKDKGTHDISKLFKLDDEELAKELTKYSLSELGNIHDICQGCIDVLIEQGAASEDLVAGGVNLHDTIYIPYLNKLSIIEDEIAVRESEAKIVSDMYEAVNSEIAFVQKSLNFEDFLGLELLKEFSSFRRDDTYSNTNYVSDGISNKELFENAAEFFDVAMREIKKASKTRHIVTTTLKNLLVMKEFAPIVDSFSLGNWIRIKVDDEIYKIRISEYGFSDDDICDLEVTISDAKNTDGSVGTISDIIRSAASMSSSYDSVKRQAKNGYKGKKELDVITNDGLNVDNVSISTGANNQTQKWDNHGMVFREYDSDTGEYSPEQMRIINSTLSITDDNWESVKTAVGKFFYVDDDGKVKTAFGVNADVLIGNLILGKQLKISAENADLTFDGDGLNVGNGDNVITINPNDKELFVIRNGVKKLLYFDTSGRLRIDGEGVYLDENATIEQIESAIMTNASNISGEIDRASAMEDLLDLSKVSKENVVSIDVIRGQSSLDDKLPNAYAIRDIVSKLDSIKYGNFSVTTDENGMFHIPLEHRYEKMYTFVSGNSNNSSIFLNTSSYSGYVLYASLGATTIELKRLSNADVTIGYIAFV